MAKKQQKRLSTKWITAIVIVLVAVFLFLQLKWFVNQDSVKTHVSDDLKISFKYPKDWYVDEKDWSIMITSYITKIGANSRPKNTQIKLFIDRFSGGCHETLEENLKDPACGEGGSSVKPNKIISKEITQEPAGVFYKYVIEYPSGKQQTFYLLQKEGTDKTLQISKEPDPSKFEKEFDDIIKSIKFL